MTKLFLILSRAGLYCLYFLLGIQPIFAETSNRSECIDLTRFHASYEYHIESGDIDTDIALEVCISANAAYPEDKEITFALGRVYAILENYEKANALFLKAFQLGSGDAAYVLSILNYNGNLNTGVSLERAFDWQQKAIELGSPQALYSMGIDYEYGNFVNSDYKKALDYYLKAAEAGVSDANIELGNIYAFSWLGVEGDLSKSKEFLMREISIGNPQALYVLAKIKINLPNDELDVIYGLKTIRDLAVNEGNTSAIGWFMAAHLLDGWITSIRQDYSAFKPRTDLAFSMLVEQLDQNSLDTVDFIYDSLDEEFFANLSQSQVSSLLVKLNELVVSSNNGMVKTAGMSAKILAKVYQEGLISAVQMKKAVKYFELAIEFGSQEAAINLGWLYFANSEIRNLDLAIKYTLIGTQGEDPYYTAGAFNNLGVFHEHPSQFDIVKAVFYYKKSVEILEANEFKSPWVVENLARIYTQGDLPSGIDPELAYKYSILQKEYGGDGFYKFILDRNNLTVDTTPNAIAGWFNEAVLLGWTNGFSELAYLEKDRNNSVEYLKWLSICVLLCEDTDTSLQSEEYLSQAFEEESGRDLTKAKKLAREWVATVWSNRKSNDPVLEAENNPDNPLNFNKINIGNNFGLLIGISDYDYLTPLKTPIRDVKRLGEVLENRYNFTINVLENPTRYEILQSLKKYKDILTPTDNLVIYYAGHGNTEDDEGYWLPADATLDDDSNWISNSYIRRKLKSYASTNILVVADSCFSGTLTRGLDSDRADNKQAEVFDIFLETKSRVVISSGGNEPVFDGGGGEHSVFAAAFLDNLRSSSKPFTSMDLYNGIRKKVMEASLDMGNSQTPFYGALPLAGHEGPDFVFVPVME